MIICDKKFLWWTNYQLLVVKCFQTSINLWISFTEGVYSYILNIFTSVSLLISRICRQFPPPHHPSVQIISGLVQSSISGCVGESLAVPKLSWKTTANCYGKCSLGTVPARTLQLKEVSYAPGLQVHPAPPCADIFHSSEMEWGPWNLRGRGDGYKKFHNKGTPVFCISHPREGNIRWLLVGMYTRKIYTGRKNQNEVIVRTK